jgi:ABC-2 type transport system ATP-binding protein
MPNLKVMERIGYMAQADALYHELTAMENLDFFAALYGLKGKKKKERIEWAASLVDLSYHLDKLVSNYSGGMKRRLSISIALLNDPDLLILDEPTVGIDPVLRKNIWATFQKLKEKGTSIIVTTHVMDEAEKCDTLGMIRNGQMIASGSPEVLKAQCHAQTMEEAFLYYGGLSYEN